MVVEQYTIMFKFEKFCGILTFNSFFVSVSLVQICEQASYTLHHIDKAELFAENSAMARFLDILGS